MAKLESILTKYVKYLPIILILVFISLNMVGITWGIPEIWHPDAVLKNAVRALEGDWEFDTVNFDYPSLPKYIMYGLGWLVLEQGGDKGEIVLAVRFFALFLGSLIIYLTFKITQRLTVKTTPAFLAALLVVFSSELAQYARFEHNDIYATFFITWMTLILLRYQEGQNRLWIYLAFLTVGWAASSKYNAGALILVPPMVYWLIKKRKVFSEWLVTLETFFIGFTLAGIGYVMGTPRALFWMSRYFRGMLPALLNHALYARAPEDVTGLLGQWGVLIDAWGVGVFLLAAAAVIYYLVRVFRSEDKNSPFTIILLVMVVFDLPIMISFNYPSRFFLSFLPLVSVLIGAFVVEVYDFLVQGERKIYANLSLAVGGLVLIYSLLRVVAIGQIFINDARISAGEFLGTLKEDASIEYTLYPPNIDRKHFGTTINYPIYFIKFPDQEIPTSPFYDFNVGEAGIKDRNPYYLVIDSLSYARFFDPFRCELNQVDCDFFLRLMDGQTDYQLIAEFEYELPWYLPEVHTQFINPDIKVYENVGGE